MARETVQTTSSLLIFTGQSDFFEGAPSCPLSGYNRHFPEGPATCVHEVTFFGSVCHNRDMESGIPQEHSHDVCGTRNSIDVQYSLHGVN